MLVLAIRAVNATPMFTWVGIVLLILTVADGVLGWTQPLHVWSDVLHILFYGYTTISLIVYMFRDDKVTNDEVFDWDDLPGNQPVRLEDHTTGGRWPVAVEGESVARFCNLDVEGTNRYCFGHMLLGTRPEVPRAPRTTAGKTVKFNL